MQNYSSKTGSFLQSNTARLILIGVLTLFLLIPLNLVENLIEERSYRQDGVVEEINEKWGNSVRIYGPILKVPYSVRSEKKNYNSKGQLVGVEEVFSSEYAYIFPENLQTNADVKTEIKKRNNYESVVFTTKMDFNGNFVKPDFSSINVSHINWKEAKLIVETQNLTSIKNQMSIKIGEDAYDLEPVYQQNENGGYDSENWAYLETSHFNLEKYFEKSDFSFSVECNGSASISFVPIGKTTETTLKSNWSAPSFSGKFLPQEKEITENGFTAHWKVLHINRPFSQQNFNSLPPIGNYSYDVDFFIPIDEYQQNTRAAKYGFLVIGLTFLVFFLLQVISKIRIHIFQYTMIGLALVMFYTLLISITEHSSFTFAYVIASFLVVLLISLYAISILKNKKFPLFIGASLAGLYAFIYVIIQLESYALLVGSLGLFSILALVMYVSRKIDWHKSES